MFFNKNSDVVLLIFIQTLVRKDFCHVRCNWYSISEVGHISENGNKWSTTLVNHKPYIFFCENFPSFIIHTEKYREFQARFSLFFILFLTEQFHNGALSVTHQRMITITLREQCTVSTVFSVQVWRHQAVLGEGWQHDGGQRDVFYRCAGGCGQAMSMMSIFNIVMI